MHMIHTNLQGKLSVQIIPGDPARGPDPLSKEEKEGICYLDYGLFIPWRDNRHEFTLWFHWPRTT